MAKVPLGVRVPGFAGAEFVAGQPPGDAPVRARDLQEVHAQHRRGARRGPLQVPDLSRQADGRGHQGSLLLT